ncbi:MAG: serpin family protein [Planctomycetes bacterium]|nr:serpin family protein [Planctomycetota bacterium]
MSDARQKTYVDVTEEGTKAAAITAIVVDKKAAEKDPPKEPPSFRADHPFLFLIVRRSDHFILCGGRVMDPSEGAAPRPKAAKR